jgi:hypothetical protein
MPAHTAEWRRAQVYHNGVLLPVPLAAIMQQNAAAISPMSSDGDGAYASSDNASMLLGAGNVAMGI